MTLARLSPALLSLSLLLACAGSRPPKCVPGASADCACAQGTHGAQVCRADGTYDACVCETPGQTATTGAAPAASTGTASTTTTGAAATPGSASATTTPPSAGTPAATSTTPTTTATAAGTSPSPATATAGDQPSTKTPSSTPAPTEPATAAPEPGRYDVTLTKGGECIALSGPRRVMPETTKTEAWRIRTSGPTAIIVEDGSQARTATLVGGVYLLTRPSEHGNATIRLRFTDDGLRGRGNADSVFHAGKDRLTAEDCTETLTVSGTKTAS